MFVIPLCFVPREDPSEMIKEFDRINADLIHTSTASGGGDDKVSDADNPLGDSVSAKTRQGERRGSVELDPAVSAL